MYLICDEFALFFMLKEKTKWNYWTKSEYSLELVFKWSSLRQLNSRYQFKKKLMNAFYGIPQSKSFQHFNCPKKIDQIHLLVSLPFLFKYIIFKL